MVYGQEDQLTSLEGLFGRVFVEGKSFESELLADLVDWPDVQWLGCLYMVRAMRHVEVYQTPNFRPSLHHPTSSSPSTYAMISTMVMRRRRRRMGQSEERYGFSSST